MDELISHITLGLTMVTIVIPLAILVSHFSHQPLEIKWLVVFLMFSFICDLSNVILYNLFQIQVNYTSAFFWLASTPILSGFFYFIFPTPLAKSTLIAVNIGYVLFAVVNFLFIQKSLPNTYTGTVQAIVVIVLSIVFFYRLLKDLPTLQVHKLPLFWIVSGFFLTFAGKLVVYTVTHYLVDFLKDSLLIIWSLHNFLTIIANVLIGYGAWLHHRQLKSTSLSL